ncbi:hypothetical protein B0H17DRAFT_1143330 [Mycena rosella]|uniref:Uncharacterized protein n=1 Tax=Mycena rosella TaxID=1033263 RepID=A0AAD7CV90_MYCRO|nr:hypothetical protein B0H17DRAFT_1143330 [Mycena rosella]
MCSWKQEYSILVCLAGFLVASIGWLLSLLATLITKYLGEPGINIETRAAATASTRSTTRSNSLRDKAASARSPTRRARPNKLLIDVKGPPEARSQVEEVEMTLSPLDSPDAPGPGPTAIPTVNVNVQSPRLRRGCRTDRTCPALGGLAQASLGGLAHAPLGGLPRVDVDGQQQYPLLSVLLLLLLSVWSLQRLVSAARTPRAASQPAFENRPFVRRQAGETAKPTALAPRAANGHASRQAAAAVAAVRGPLSYHGGGALSVPGSLPAPVLPARPLPLRDQQGPKAAPLAHAPRRVLPPPPPRAHPGRAVPLSPRHAADPKPCPCPLSPKHAAADPKPPAPRPRTQPYAAPYFIPPPDSADAVEPAVRRRPSRRRTAPSERKSSGSVPPPLFHLSPGSSRQSLRRY